jgi:hypothetical protein
MKADTREAEIHRHETWRGTRGNWRSPTRLPDLRRHSVENILDQRPYFSLTLIQTHFIRFSGCRDFSCFILLTETSIHDRRAMNERAQKLRQPAETNFAFVRRSSRAAS